MDSIIKTIVDMDKRARKRTMEEQEFFDRADSELAEQAKKLQAEEQERADSEIAKTASEYDAKLKEALAAIDKKACAVSDALDVQSEQNRAKWAQVLAGRAVNAD